MRKFLLPREASRFFRWLRRVTIATVCIHLALVCRGMYRRIWQVQRIELVVASTVLAQGSTVGFDVVTSGEVHNRIQLELVQGDRRKILLEQRASVNRINTYDPRLFRYRPNVTIDSAHLSGFSAGPAVLRLTVFGGRKLLRTPPPRVRELDVRLGGDA